jgi:hypothetical protein
MSKTRVKVVSKALLHLFCEQMPQFASPAGRHSSGRKPSGKISARRQVHSPATNDLADDLDPLPHVAERGYAANLPERLIAPTRETPDHDCPAETAASRFPLVQFSIRPRNGSSRPGLGFAPAYIRFCRLIDVSMNGLAIMTTHPLTAGATLDFWISDTAPRPHLELQGTVLRCEPLPRDEGFRIVCRLSRFLSFPEIHRIGRTLFDAAIV